MEYNWHQYCVSFRWYLHGFPCGACVKEPACQCRRQKRHGFDPWVRKIPWRRKWQPSPVFLPEESRGQRSLAGSWGHKESDTTEGLNNNIAFSDCCLVLWRGLKSRMNSLVIWWFHSLIQFLKCDKTNLKLWEKIFNFFLIFNIIYIFFILKMKTIV